MGVGIVDIIVFVVFAAAVIGIGLWQSRGERMLGGSDKGAAGALVEADSVVALKQAVATGYPRTYTELADRYAIHVCRVVDGIAVLDQRL